MLNDLKRVSEREEIDPDRLRQVAATLVTRQFLYFDMDKDKKSYRTLVNNVTYFDNLFDALNHDFIYDSELGMVGILPRSRMTSLRLKKEEALLLLNLRFIYEEALESFNIKKGCAYTNSEKLIAKYQVSTGAEQRPLLTDMRRILTEFKRFGLIDDIQEIDNRILDFRIRPAVRFVLNESWFKTLEQHAGIISDKDEPEDDQANDDIVYDEEGA